MDCPAGDDEGTDVTTEYDGVRVLPPLSPSPSPSPLLVELVSLAASPAAAAAAASAARARSAAGTARRSSAAGVIAACQDLSSIYHSNRVIMV